MNSISLDVDGQLVKIDGSRAEYLLFNLILTFYSEMLYDSEMASWDDGFTARQLFTLVQKLPNSIWPEFRKKQTYLSGLLSRNEIDSLYTPNRKLFKRVRRGYYFINPMLKIKSLSGWEFINPYAWSLGQPHAKTRM